MEEVEKEFISVLNLDCDPFDESDYNCVAAIRTGNADDEPDILDDKGLHQIMPLQDAVPYCRECSSYEHLTANCPKASVKTSCEQQEM